MRNLKKIIQLSVGFETNQNNNASRTFERYSHFLLDLNMKYCLVKLLTCLKVLLASLDSPVNLSFK